MWCWSMEEKRDDQSAAEVLLSLQQEEKVVGEALL